MSVAPAAVAQHRHRLGDLHAERPHPVDAGVALDDPAPSAGSPSGFTSRITSAVGAVQMKPA